LFFERKLLLSLNVFQTQSSFQLEANLLFLQTVLNWIIKDLLKTHLSVIYE